MTKKRASLSDTEIEINEFSKKNVEIVKETSKLISSINIDVNAKSDNQRKLISTIKNKQLTLVSGPPGCGKTFIACATSLNLLKEQKYRKIYLVKSVTSLKDEEIGYLKGTMQEKMEPFMFSFMGNIEKIIGKEKMGNLVKSNIIEVIPIAYLRGVTLDGIIIVDECQNISVQNMRTILSRLGENSKMILMGDENQIDKKDKNDSALQFLMRNFEDIEEIGMIKLTHKDQQRNPIITKIEKRFEELQNPQPKQ